MNAVRSNSSKDGSIASGATAWLGFTGAADSVGADAGARFRRASVAPIK
jgi:hypothetical protein